MTSALRVGSAGCVSGTTEKAEEASRGEGSTAKKTFPGEVSSAHVLKDGLSVRRQRSSEVWSD